MGVFKTLPPVAYFDPLQPLHIFSHIDTYQTFYDKGRRFLFQLLFLTHPDIPSAIPSYIQAYIKKILIPLTQTNSFSDTLDTLDTY